MAIRVHPLKFTDIDSMRSYLADYIEHGVEMGANVIEVNAKARTIKVAAPSRAIARLGAKPAKRKVTKTAFFK